jgi:hypothetical protein
VIGRRSNTKHGSARLETQELINLVSELFAAISSLSTYPEPYHLPPVQLRPVTELQQMVCKGPCQVRGFYLPRKGVFLNDALDVEHDVIARSVLLHELVHHLQEISGRYSSMTNQCDRWWVREREAYDIQNAYLRANGSAVRFQLDSLPYMCGDR